MTKINKLGKSTFVIAILSFLLVAVLAFGGTYAYFSASAGTVSGTITTGHLRIGDVTGTAVEAIEGQNTTLKLDGTLAQPNQTIMNDTFSAEVTTNIAYYTRVKFTVSVKVLDADNDGEADHAHAKEDCVDKFTSALDALTIGTIVQDVNEGEATVENDNPGWKAGADSFTTTTAKEASTSKYFYKLKATRPEKTPGTPSTEITTKEEGTTTITENFKIVVKVNPQVGLAAENDAAGCAYWMDADITISVTFEVLQAEYLFATEGADTAAVEFKTGADAEKAWTDALKGIEGTKPATGA